MATRDSISYSPTAQSPAVHVQPGSPSLTLHLTRGHLRLIGLVLAVGVPTLRSIPVGKPNIPSN